MFRCKKKIHIDWCIMRRVKSVCGTKLVEMKQKKDERQIVFHNFFLLVYDEKKRNREAKGSLKS